MGWSGIYDVSSDTKTVESAQRWNKMVLQKVDTTEWPDHWKLKCQRDRFLVVGVMGSWCCLSLPLNPKPHPTPHPSPTSNVSHAQAGTKPTKHREWGLCWLGRWRLAWTLAHEASREGSLGLTPKPFDEPNTLVPPRWEMMSVVGDLIGKGTFPCPPIVSWGWLKGLQFDVHKEEHADYGELHTCPSVTTTMCPAWQRRWCPHATFERCQMCRIRRCFFFKIRLYVACVIRGHRLPSKAHCWISGGPSLASSTTISSTRSGKTP